MDSNTYFLSILIPTWNRVDSVIKAIESIGSPPKDLEVIVVDDGSEFRFFSALKEKISNYSNVKLFRNEENIGMVRNWNKCIIHSSGEWMGLLCDDDTYTEGAFQRIYSLMKTLNTPSLIVRDPSIIKTVEMFSSGRETAHNLKLPLASGNFWHRKVVETIGCFDESLKYSPDAEFWPRIAFSFPVIKLRDSIAHYNQHNSNYMWTTWRKEDLLKQIELVSLKVLKYGLIDDNRINIEVEKSVFNTILYIIQTTFLRKGKSDIFRKYVKEGYVRADSIGRKCKLLVTPFQAIGYRLIWKMASIPLLRKTWKKILRFFRRKSKKR